MNKNALILGAVVIVLVGGFLLLGRRTQTKAPATTMVVATSEPTAVPTLESISPTKGTEKVTAKVTVTTKTFTVDAKNFSFSPTEIKVKKGDMVKVTLNVKEGLHDWVVDEFNARTKQTAEGKTDTVEFTASKTGTFEYYCSIGQHRKMGMVGKLIVE